MIKVCSFFCILFLFVSFLNAQDLVLPFDVVDDEYSVVSEDIEEVSDLMSGVEVSSIGVGSFLDDDLGVILPSYKGVFESFNHSPIITRLEGLASPYNVASDRILEEYVRTEFSLVLRRQEFAIRNSIIGIAVGSFLSAVSGVAILTNDTLIGAGIYNQGSTIDSIITISSSVGIALGLSAVVAFLITYGYHNKQYLTTVDNWVRYINVSQ